jgi:hypothetical protein
MCGIGTNVEDGKKRTRGGMSEETSEGAWIGARKEE